MMPELSQDNFETNNPHESPATAHKLRNCANSRSSTKGDSLKSGAIITKGKLGNENNNVSPSFWKREQSDAGIFESFVEHSSVIGYKRESDHRY